MENLVGLASTSSNGGIPAWVDSFLFWDLVVVSSLAFADWMLGVGRRKQMRDVMGYWSLYLDDVTFHEIALESVSRAASWLEGKIGVRLWSSRRFLCALGIALIVAVFTSFLFLLMPDKDGSTYLEVLITNSVAAVLTTPGVAVALTICTRLLRAAANRRSLLFYFLTSLASLFSMELLALTYYFLLSFYHENLNTNASAVASASVSFMLVAPTMFHLAYLLLVVTLKFTRRLVIRPMAVALRRLHESDKGVLSQLAIGLGTVAKLIQVATKYYQ